MASILELLAWVLNRMEDSWLQILAWDLSIITNLYQRKVNSLDTDQCLQWVVEVRCHVRSSLWSRLPVRRSSSATLASLQAERERTGLCLCNIQSKSCSLRLCNFSNERTSLRLAIRTTKLARASRRRTQWTRTNKSRKVTWCSQPTWISHHHFSTKDLATIPYLQVSCCSQFKSLTVPSFHNQMDITWLYKT